MAIHRFDEFELDTTLYQLRHGEAVLDVGPRIFDVLAYLIRHRDRLVSRDELIRQVWGVTAMSDSSVPTCIAAIRKALGDDPAKPRFVETHRGRGYRFIGTIDVLEPESDRAAGADSIFDRSARPDVQRARFVGRERELSALYAAFERSLASSPQVVLLMGEPGIGKTRTIEEFAFAAREDGARILIGRSIEGEGAPSFWPWIQIVRSFIDSPGISGFPGSVGPLASSLAQMIPELADQFPELPKPPDLDPEQARFRLFDAVTALLEAAARERPLVVLIDDLHRADAASISLLRFATRELRDTRVLILGTYRDTEIAAGSNHSRSLSDLAREEASRSIQLRGFDLENVEQFVAEFAPAGADRDALAASLHEQTGGNPFFLTQLVHLLATQGLLERGGAAALRTIDLPDGIREAVARQLDGLSAETSGALGIAAVAGREFDASIIGDLLGNDLQPVISTLEPALNAHLVARVPGSASRYRFSHILLRDCVYEALPAPERTRLHLEIATALEERYAARLGPRTAELAYHYTEAVPIAGLDHAIRYSVLAAQWADSRLAYEDAPTHYRRAIHLLEQRSPGDPVEYANLLLTLGDAEIKAGDRAAATETFKEAVRIARECDDPEILARAALGLAPGFFAIEVGVYDPYLVSLLNEALEKIPDGDSSLRARLLARLSTALVWSHTDRTRFDLAQSAMGMASRIADPRTTATVLSGYHESLWGANKLNERFTIIDRIGSISHSTKDPEIALTYHLLKATADLEAGEVTSADQEFAAYARIASETRQTRYTWYTGLFQGTRALMNGEHALAEHYAHKFLITGQQANDSNADQSFGVHLAILRWEQNQIRELLPMVDMFIAKYPAVTAWKCVRMFLSFELNDLDDARRRYKAISRDCFTAVRSDPNRVVSLCLLAEVAAPFGRTDDSVQLRNLLVQDQTAFAVIGFCTGFFGSVASRIGLLEESFGDLDLAITKYRNAIEQEESVMSPPWIARTDFLLARALFRRGGRNDIKEAQTRLENARKIASRIGLKRLAHQLDSIE